LPMKLLLQLLPIDVLMLYNMWEILMYRDQHIVFFAFT
jgi:hypothetical protein